MAVKLIVVGKTKEAYFRSSEAEYLKRLTRYSKLEYIEVPASKNETNALRCKQQEADGISKRIKPTDFVVLLDEKGKHYSSVQFAEIVNRWVSDHGTLVFVTGGAFGFDDSIYERANTKVSLSAMTFPHHLVRTMFLEQLYRAFTILNGGKYHNE